MKVKFSFINGICKYINSLKPINYAQNIDIKKVFLLLSYSPATELVIIVILIFFPTHILIYYDILIIVNFLCVTNISFMYSNSEINSIILDNTILFIKFPDNSLLFYLHLVNIFNCFCSIYSLIWTLESKIMDNTFWIFYIVFHLFVPFFLYLVKHYNNTDIF